MHSAITSFHGCVETALLFTRLSQNCRQCCAHCYMTLEPYIAAYPEEEEEEGKEDEEKRRMKMSLDVDSAYILVIKTSFICIVLTFESDGWQDDIIYYTVTNNL